MLKYSSKVALLCLGCLSQPLLASSATVQVSAQVIAPADVSTQAVTQLLSNQAPGVVTLIIPGSCGAPASAVEVIATATPASTVSWAPGGACSLVQTASSPSMPSTSQIFAAAGEAATSPCLRQSLSTKLATKGILNGQQGVQIAVMNLTQGAAGCGSVSAIVTFD